MAFKALSNFSIETLNQDTTRAPYTPKDNLDYEVSFQRMKMQNGSKFGCVSMESEEEFVPRKARGFCKNIPHALRDIQNLDNAKDRSYVSNNADWTKKMTAFQRRFQNKQTYQRNTAFLARYGVPKDKDIREMKSEANTIKQLSLQCNGAGHFDAQIRELQGAFLEYLHVGLSTLTNLNTLRVTFSGFDVHGGVLQELLLLLRQAQNIPTVELSFTHLTNASAQDFSEVMGLMALFEHQEGCHNLSLQVSSWHFASDFDFAHFEESFEDITAVNQSKLELRQLRLEISALFTNEAQAQDLLRSVVKMNSNSSGEINPESRLELFHSEMVKLVHKISAIFPHLDELVFDMRHWSSKLKMEHLRKKLESQASPTFNEYSIGVPSSHSKGNGINRTTQINYFM